jgi:hypothetical protein
MTVSSRLMLLVMIVRISTQLRHSSFLDDISRRFFSRRHGLVQRSDNTKVSQTAVDCVLFHRCLQPGTLCQISHNSHLFVVRKYRILACC